ncbi:MAG TPA: peptidoglycan-binding protein [Myxococcaceae bacterium]|nr:peptidoglycan-binding protein [Myxococcaceae bacterium]
MERIRSGSPRVSSPPPSPASSPTDRASGAGNGTRTNTARTNGVSSFSGTGPSNPNAILGRLQTTGASNRTAGQDGIRQGGVAASRQMAMTDLPRLQQYRSDIESVARQHDLPPALLAAIISRESRGGAALDANGRGDGGRGYGLMQVDRGTAAGVGGPRSRENIEQGARILRDKLGEVRRAHPDWTPEQQLRGAVAAYNMGARNVQTLGGMDRGTTGDDYSADVWARAQTLAPHFGGAAAGGATSQPELSPDAPGTARRQSGTTGTTGASGRGNLERGADSAQVGSVQRQLRAAGFSPGPIDNKFGPRTEAAVRRFQEAHGLKVDGIVGPRTRAALAAANEPGAQRPTTGGSRPTGGTTGGSRPTTGGSRPTTGGAAPTNTNGLSLGNGLRVDTNHPTLRTLATADLRNGRNYTCVATTHANLQRLGLPTYSGVTGADPNNPRGALVKTLRTGQWESVPTPGSQLRTIRSPAYGTVQAHVIPASEYRRLAAAGQIPSGALVFQTRHGWEYSGGSRGNDMAIVRNGGRQVHNYATMGGIVYRDLKEVVVMVPRGALQRE